MSVAIDVKPEASSDRGNCGSGPRAGPGHGRQQLRETSHFFLLELMNEATPPLKSDL